MLRKKMLKISKSHTRDLKIIRKQLKKLPPGKFFCCKEGKYDKWYYRDGQKQIYIPKKDRHLAEQLAFKRYLTDLEKDLIDEKNGADAYLQFHTSDIRRSDQLLNNRGYQELLAPFFKPHSQELIDWMNEPYEKSKSHPEYLIYKTVSGNVVRSKSEMLIDMALYKNKIPFRYEAPLMLSNKTYHPDFTIRHPRTGKTYYWEHLGLINQSPYYEKTYDKLKDFISNGIVPTYNLILTFETPEFSLSSEFIEKIITHYFLD